MRRTVEHQRQGIFVAEGEKVVRRLLGSDFGVVSLLVPPGWVEKLGEVLAGRPEDVAVYVADKQTLEALTGFSFYQGVLGVGRIPQSKSVEDVLAASRSPRLLVALDSLANAENLGAVVRNAAAMGVHGLIVGETCSSPFLRRSVRSSMGGIFDLPVAAPASLVEALGVVRRAGVRTVAAHPRPESTPLWDINLRQDCCLVFGSEGYGISREVLDLCDCTAAVPMTLVVDSLNVGAATAVFLYEVLRQRAVQ